MSNLQRSSSSGVQNSLKHVAISSSPEQVAQQQSVLRFSDHGKNDQNEIIRFLVDHNIKFSKPHYNQRDYEAIVKIYNIYEIKEKEKKKKETEYSAIYKKFSNFFEKKKENLSRGQFSGEQNKSANKSGSPGKSSNSNKSLSPSPAHTSTAKKGKTAHEAKETTKKSGFRSKSPESPNKESKKRLNKSSTSSPNLLGASARGATHQKDDLEKIYGPLLNFFHDTNRQGPSKSPEKRRGEEDMYQSKQAKKKHREIGEKVHLKKTEMTPLLKRYQMNFEEEDASSKGPKSATDYSAFTEYPSNKFKQEMESRRKKQTSFIKMEEEWERAQAQAQQVLAAEKVREDQRKNFLRDTISSQRKSIKCEDGSPLPLKRSSIIDNNSLSPARGDVRGRKSITGGFSERRKSARNSDNLAARDVLPENIQNGRAESPIFEPCFGGGKGKTPNEDEINFRLEKNFKDIVKKELAPFDKSRMDTEAARKYYQKAVQSLYEGVDMLSSEELVFYYKFILNRAKLLYIDFLNQRGIKLC